MSWKLAPDLTLRDQIEAEGVASLTILVDVALGHSGQCRYIARFLAALYNGPRFRFDPTDLRAIDTALFLHCLTVLRMDHRCIREVHTYFENGSDLWEQKIIGKWSLDAEQLRNAVRTVRDGLERPVDEALYDDLERRFPREPL